MALDVLNAAERIIRGEEGVSDWFRGVPDSIRLDVAPATAMIVCRGLSGNVTALKTDEGLILCDTGAVDTCERVLAEVRRWEPDAPIHSVLYTHGHFDHVAGIGLIEADAAERGFDRPIVIAHENVLGRFERYRMTAALNRKINIRQYSRPDFRWPEGFRHPDIVVRDSHDHDMGGETFTIIHGKGETDDHAWLWAPDRKLIVAGDFYTWAAPNAGNPQKVQRYAPDWAITLRRMIERNAEILVPGHGPPVFGRESINRILDDAACWLESLHNQTVELMNEGLRVGDIIHRFEVPERLRNLSWLEPNYDDPEFVVRGICRLYGGWWDGNPANLKPAPEADLARELAAVAGGADRLAERARALLENGDLRLAGHFAEFAALAAPCDPAVHATRASVYRARVSAERAQMAKGVFRDAAAASEKLV
ncbi:alkyl sulfatase dimerization domain-containing protein [Oceanibacterium hippocampi]|uniref:Beta-lactamase 2 n=1 Tax=Oceanibacterium hippocampi TaxID=745714 RepID=A0A1Y5TUS5_9PROT|nr:alkyl sulfatase dimerization domain-containing protein [Oceanibacterium hippocampi]SLN70671.1 Beta-lactamase 2 precursor [Oceanibacterium hippocampi]